MWFWERVIPEDTRGWLTLGVFALMVYILSLVAFVPDLDKSQLFTALASGVVGAGFGSAIGYFFGTNKGSSDRNETVNKALDLAKNAPILVDPPVTVEVDDKK